MKVSQLQALLAALEGVCDVNNNANARDGLKKFSTLFDEYKNHDVKKATELIAKARIEGGLQR